MISTINDSFLGGPKYLNTTNYGLFPKAAIDVMHKAAQGLGDGSFDTCTRDEAVEASRSLFAQMIGVENSHVSVGCSASPFAGLVANAIPDGSNVLLVEDPFTSLTLPFVVQQDRLRVAIVSIDEFIDAIDETIDYAVVSAAQSADGTVVDLGALGHKRTEHNVKVILDTTQASGWLPISGDQYDVVIAAAYKWLLCPRGVAFAYFSQEMIENTKPLFAGWYAAENTHTGYYGTDVPLATSARKFDTSPSGLNWIGARPALELLTACGVTNINEHNVGLANHFRQGIGVGESNSAIVSIPINSDSVEKLRNADVNFGLQEGKRQGNARFAFHLYNSPGDVALALSCLG